MSQIPNRKIRVAIFTGGGRMGYTARMLYEMERRGMVDIVVVDCTRPAVSGLEIDRIYIDEESMTRSRVTPSPKRSALVAQLHRAKLRRDKNAVRDLTRQLERM